MKANKVISIIATFAIAISALIPSTSLLNNVSAENSLTQGSMKIDFEDYVLNGDNAGSRWSLKSDSTQGKYLELNKGVGEKTSGNMTNCSFLANPTGDYKDENNTFHIKNGETYNISFKYKLSKTDSNKNISVCFDAPVGLKNEWQSKKFCPVVKTRYKLDVTEDWKIFSETVTADITELNADESLTFRIRISPNYGKNDSEFGFVFSIDDVVVESTLWQGQSNISEFDAGDGSAENPYQISKPSQLAYLAKTVSEVSSESSNPTKNKRYILTADMELNNVKNANWTDTANRWYYGKNTTQAFLGVLNGQGHKIKGLYINTDPSETSYGGLFGTLGSGAQIKNLTVESSYIKSTYAGALAGCVDLKNKEQVKLRRIVVDACRIYSSSSDLYSGGILGSVNADVLIENFLSTADIGLSSEKVGSVIGELNAKATLNYGILSSSSKLIGKKGSDAVIAAKTVYSLCDEGIAGVTRLDGEEKMHGTDAKTNMPDLDFESIWAVGASGQLPHLGDYSSSTDQDDDAVPDKIWSGKIAKSFAAGDGSKENPYLITNADELALLANDVKSKTSAPVKTAGKYYELANDISINDTTDPDWKTKVKDQWISGTTTGARFEGVLDGKGHTIKGIYIDKVSADGTASNQGTYGGLFIAVGNAAVIKNLAVDDSYIRADAAGGFAGAVHVSSAVVTAPQLIGCYSGSGVEISSSKNQQNSGGGGFVGSVRKPLTFRYCYSKAKVSAEAKIDETNDLKQGSFVGYSFGDDKIKYRSSYSAPTDPALNIQGGTKSGSPKATNTYATANKLESNKAIVTDVGLVSDLRMLGSTAKDAMTGLDFEKVWKTVDGGTPILRVFDKSDSYCNLDLESYEDPFERPIKDDARPGDIWSGGIASSLKGKGTEAEPYEIWTGEDLTYFVQQILESSWGTAGKETEKQYPTLNKYYEIKADIYLNDVSSANWYENANNNQWLTGFKHSQAFQGKLNGAGHIIYGLYFNTDSQSYVGLIPSIGQYALIENLGLASSYLYNEGSGSAALVAQIENKNGTSGLPTIRNCFVSEDVQVVSKSSIAGGMVGFAASSVKVVNSYSLASLQTSNDKLKGGIIAYVCMQVNTKTFADGTFMNSVMENCYVCNADKSLTVGTQSYDSIITENTYALKSEGINGAVVSFSKMTGENAKESFAGFDFENVWITVEKSTPALRVFASRPDYESIKSKLVRFKGPVTISFETYGGSEEEPIVGEAGTKIKLPTPVRSSDIFEGWYVYPLETWDVPFTYDYMPDDDVTLYAKWDTKNIQQGFEQYNYTSSSEDGLEEGYEVNKPGYKNYDPQFVHDGSKSLYRMPTEEGYKNALLSTEYTVDLIPGAEYELSMWVNVIGNASADDELMLAYLQDSDWAFDEDATEAICKLNGIKTGGWQNVTFKFVAYGKYIGIRTPAVEMYIDDVNITYTGKTGLKSKAVVSPLKTVTTVLEDDAFEDTTNNIIETEEDNNNNSAPSVGTKKKKIIRKIIKRNNSSNTLTYIIVISAAVVAVAGGTAVFIILKKKKSIIKLK